MEAASGIAGLLSLGVTVCQSLLDYYESWKHAEENVAKTYSSIEELFKTLKLLSNAVEHKGINSEIVSQIRNSISSAEASIYNLRKKLDKVRLVAVQDSWRDKAKAQFRRTLYPFKESTLAKLRELSGETRNNLSLALHLLQIDTSVASLRQLDLLGQQATKISTGVDFLTQQSTSISADLQNIAGYARRTVRVVDSVASMDNGNELRLWLSGHVDPSQKQDETWRDRHADTGQWFFQSSEFRTWLEGPSQQTPRVLNLIGKSGAGKTSLISGAIRSAQSMQRDDPQTANAYFYCSFDDAASQEPVNMIGSFIAQVSAVCPNMLEGLEVDFARAARPTLTDLEQRLSQTARSSSKMLLLIDAVNECKKVGPMIETLLRLAESVSDIRVLFTSTEEDPTIMALTDLQPPKATTVRMSALTADIDIFIEAKIKEKENLQRLPQEIKDEITEVLSRKADGM